MLLRKFLCYFGVFLLLKVCRGNLRDCETRNGSSEKLFSITSSSQDQSYIGTLDIVGVTTGSQQTIEINLLPNKQICGSKSCNEWVNFDPETQVLTLNKKAGRNTNLEAHFSDLDAIEVIINCRPMSKLYPYNDVSITVTVKIEYKDDVKLIVIGEPHEIRVNEIVEIGVSVLNITVADLENMNQLSYYVLPGSLASQYFEIPNPNRGDIRVKTRFDYEELAKIERTELELEVEVRYRGKYGVLTSRTIVTVYVEDADDQAPVFQSDGTTTGIRVNLMVYGAYVQEYSRNPTTLLIRPNPILAVDNDVIVKSPIEYSLTMASPKKCSAYFEINQFTGSVSTLKTILPKSDMSKCFFYVKATQANNKNMFSYAELHISVVHQLEDLYKPVVISDTQAFLDHSIENQVQFLKTGYKKVLKIIATDKDYGKNGQPIFKFHCQPSHLFTITDDGYIISHISDRDVGDLNIQVTAENTDATNPNHRFSDVAHILIHTEKVLRSRVVPRNATNCLSETNDDAAPALVVMGIFIALFVLSIIAIVGLVIKLRRYKTLCLETEKRNFELNQSAANNFGHFGYNNRPFSVDSISFSSSGNGYKHTVDLAKQYENVLRLPRVDDEVPHITPLDVNNLNEFTDLKTDDRNCIVPYGSSTLLQEWENVENSLDYNQIRVENWLSEKEEKKCGVGEIKLNVYKPCFVKILTGECSDKDSASNDVAAMKQLLYYKNCDNKNIIKFYGCCVEEDCLYMVSEFVSSRDLRTVLLSSRMLEHSAVISTLSGTQLMNFIIGIANGVEYLHNNNFVHGAISSRRIRVNDRLVPKIAECCGRNSQRYRLKSNRWASPEYKYTDKSDVWSWGVTAWEILSLGGLPFGEYKDNQVKGYVKRQLQTGASLFPVTRNTTKRLWVLLQNCWSEDPLDRVTMAEIVLRLNTMKESSNAITVARAPGYQFFPSSTH